MSELSREMIEEDREAEWKCQQRAARWKWGPLAVLLCCVAFWVVIVAILWHLTKS